MEILDFVETQSWMGLSQVTDIEPRSVRLCQDSLSAPFVVGGGREGGGKEEKEQSISTPFANLSV